MFICRGLTLSAPHRNSLYAQAKSVRLAGGDTTWALHNTHTGEYPRGFHGSWDPAAHARRGLGDVFTITTRWDSSRGIISHREPFSFASPALSRSQQQHTSLKDLIYRDYGVHENHRNTVSSVLFTSGKEVGVPRLFYTPAALQKRLLSTAATTKHKPGEEEAADHHDKGEQGSTPVSPKAPEPKADPGKGEPGRAHASPTAPEPEADPGQGQPSRAQQLKKVFKEYGLVGVSFHISIALTSLGMFYLLVSSGLDVQWLLTKVGLSESVVQSKMATGGTTFALAYAVHKLFAPLRMSITVVSVPLIVRYFRKIGFFKPPTSTP